MIELCMFFSLRARDGRHIRFCGRLAGAVMSSRFPEAIVFLGTLSHDGVLQFFVTPTNRVAFEAIDGSTVHGFDWHQNVFRAATAYFKKSHVSSVVFTQTEEPHHESHLPASPGSSPESGSRP
jgi:hypothetical protein